MFEWLYAVLVVLVAAALQTATGFGFAIMATPLLLAVFDLRDCIQINIFLGLIISAVMLPRVWRWVDYGLLLRLLAGGVVGIPAGVAVFLLFDVSTLKTIISLAIITVILFLSRKNGEAETSDASELADSLEQLMGRASLASAKRAIADPKGRHELLVGVFAGALTSSIAMPGVALMLYYAAANTKKEVARSTTLAYHIVVCIVTILAMLIVGQLRQSAVEASLILIPATAIGIYAGHRCFVKIKQQTFRRIIYVVLIFTAVYLLAFGR